MQPAPQRFVAGLARVLARRFLFTAFVPLLLLLVGTYGYSMIEGWTILESLYMSVITLTTVGFNEVHPLSTAGRIFTMFLAMGGIFTLLYAAMEVIRSVVSGQLQDILGRQKMERNLALMKDHMIVCGYGRMGRLVCQEFAKEGHPYVVIERRADLLEGFDATKGISLQGEATSDEMLRHAGIARARGLVTVAASDADNLYITLSARLLNDKLFIVARAEEPGAEQKLLRAGANRVVAPYQIGGIRVAQAVLRPTVVDFLELATATEHFDLQIEEAKISPKSSLAGSTLKDSRLRQDLGVIIVTIKRASGELVFNPPHDAPLQSEDILIAIGDREHLDRLEALAEGTKVK